MNAFQRKFVNEVRRCDEMERKLRYIEAEVKKDKISIPDISESEIPRSPNSRESVELEAHLEKTENEMLELSQNAINLKSNYLELTELRNVLERTHNFFSEHDHAVSETFSNEDQTVPQKSGRLGFIAGVIQRERVPAFERMLWRISRGNVFLRQAELDEPLEDPQTVSVLMFVDSEICIKLNHIIFLYRVMNCTRQYLLHSFKVSS